MIVHPECRPGVVERADAVLGTGGMIRFVKETEAQEVIVGTEEGMIYRLRQERPDIKFYLLSPGLLCPDMKYTTPDKVVSSLENMQHRITVPQRSENRRQGPSSECLRFPHLKERV